MDRRQCDQAAGVETPSLERGGQSRRTAYRFRGYVEVEYFIVATAMTLAALWLWDGGQFHGVFDHLEPGYGDH